ncbi:MAG: sensor histidine kinase [Blastocatellia bacterium]
MRLRSSLYAKILLIVLLNLGVIGLLVVILLNLQYRVDPDRFFLAARSNQFEVVARMMGDDLREAPPGEIGEYEAILKRYEETWEVQFLLYAPTGGQLAGPATRLPPQIRQRVIGPGVAAGLRRNRNAERPWRRLPPPDVAPEGAPNVAPDMAPDVAPEGEPSPLGEGAGGALRGRAFPFSRSFLGRTESPTRYWAGTRIVLPAPADAAVPYRVATLLAVSDSFTGKGLFFDLRPVLTLAGSVFLISILLWLPFVRRLTGSIKLLTQATEEIANEQFTVRVNDERRDELGRLGKAVNHLAVRLDGFVNGQKRFLGDISHELNTPLARMQFALGILEERADPAMRGYVEDVREEVVLMSQLVQELLAYARTGIKGVEIHLSRVALRPLLEKVVAREAPDHLLRIEAAEEIHVLVQPDLLTRALSNLIRNALRYAGGSGEIVLSARELDPHTVEVRIRDHGPGIPDTVRERIFDPFYRVESDRGRTTGGSGLGLAIVRTCVEACGGTVSARNAQPGLEVILRLRS